MPTASDAVSGVTDTDWSDGEVAPPLSGVVLPPPQAAASASESAAARASRVGDGGRVEVGRAMFVSRAPGTLPRMHAT